MIFQAEKQKKILLSIKDRWKLELSNVTKSKVYNHPKLRTGHKIQISCKYKCTVGETVVFVHEDKLVLGYCLPQIDVQINSHTK